MWAIIERSKKIILLLILSIIPLILLFVQSKDKRVRHVLSLPFIEAAGLVESVCISVTGNVSDFLFRYFYLSDYSSELLRLRAKNLQVENLETKLHALINENASLRELELYSSQYGSHSYALANVIARVGAPMARMIRIDKGTKDGVFRESPVIAHEGAIGQVLSASFNFSDVLLITDASFSIDVRIIRSNARGVLRGSSTKHRYFMDINGIDGLREVSLYDEVITSGINSLFPSGIPVGKVVEVHKAKDGLSIQVKVKPHVDIDSIKHVSVFRGSYVHNKSQSLNAPWPLASQ